MPFTLRSPGSMGSHAKLSTSGSPNAPPRPQFRIEQVGVFRVGVNGGACGGGDLGGVAVNVIEVQMRNQNLCHHKLVSFKVFEHGAEVTACVYH